MNQLLRCAKGHQWPTTPVAGGVTVDIVHACPFCGSTEISFETQPAADGPIPSEPNQAHLATLSAAAIEPTPHQVAGTVAFEAGSPNTVANVTPSAAKADPNVGTLTLPPVPPVQNADHPLVVDRPDQPGTRLEEAGTSAKGVNPTNVGGPIQLTGGAARPGEFTAKREGVPPTNIGPARLKKDTKLPDKIGSYEILAELGRGGMGVVYQARQAGLNRLCALKMILGGGRASADAVARFKIEAEAIAHLQHPNIVQVYEIGEENDCPYFSLEFVEGSNLQSLIAQTPQPAVATARMMQQICEGVNAAHQRGVLHRDLKPANVLLTKDNIPKITDFGLAKRLEEKDHGQTRTGAIMGTPSYMAPEQAMGRSKEVGPPADIYALGAVLYDMLTGRPPFRGETVMETLSQVQNLDPLPPARLVPKVSLDLQTICLKALNKDPKNRYATAGDMAEDLRRFLAGEPIMARPTPTWERAVKWTKRRPALATLISVSIVGFVSFLTLGGFWLNDKRLAAEERETQSTNLAKIEKERREEAERLRKEADTQRDLAETHFKEAEVQRERAEANFRQARDAVDQMLTRVGSVNLAYEPRMEQTRKELLQKALDYYLKFLDQRRDDPAVRYEAAKAYHRVGEISRMLAKYEDAVTHYQVALNRYQELSKNANDNLTFRQGAAASLMEMAVVRHLQGKLPDSEKGYQLALAEFSQLAKDYPKNMLHQEELANLHVGFGNLCISQGRLQDAERHFNTALDLRSNLITKGLLRNAVASQPLARLHLNRGVLLLLIGKSAEAEKSLLAARDSFAALAKQSPEVPDYAFDWAGSFVNLAICYRKSNRPQPASDALREALDLLQKLQAKFPSTPVYRQELARATYELGMLRGEQGQIDQAQEQLAKALQLQKLLHDEFPQLPGIRLQLAQSQISLGIALVHLNEAEQALDHYRTGVVLLEDIQPTAETAADVCSELARGHENLAELLTALKQPLEADKSWTRLLSLRQELAKASPDSLDRHRELAETHLLFADRFQKADKNPDAASHWKSAAAELAQCMILASGNKSLTEKDRKTLVADFGNKSLAALKKAVDLGFKDANYLNTAPEFRLLREREEFQALVRKMEGKAL